MPPSLSYTTPIDDTWSTRAIGLYPSAKQIEVVCVKLVMFPTKTRNDNCCATILGISTITTPRNPCRQTQRPLDCDAP